MKVVIFGATGMVGQGVLRECVRDAGVERVLCVGRRASSVVHPKVTDLIVEDPGNLGAVERQLTGLDACFFCLGVSSVGMKEADYRRITYDLTLGAATTLARLDPQMSFIYVSGAGTDSTERGSSMWARVKGATENALMRLPFKATYMFRPGGIQPMHKVRSKTPLYHAAYWLASPLLGLLARTAPRWFTTSEQVGRAMLVVARRGAPSPLVESIDINTLR